MTLGRAGALEKAEQVAKAHVKRFEVRSRDGQSAACKASSSELKAVEADGDMRRVDKRASGAAQSAGELGATAGAGAFAPGKKRERRCELLKRD